MILKLSDIHAGYGPKEVLKGISLEIAPGEIVALLGSNGAGKSTVLKIIDGLLTPNTGAVSFCGQDISRVPAYKRAENGIGYLMQNGPVFGSLTVGEHHRLVGSKSNGVLNGDSFLKIDKSRCGGVLSGGERQRLAVELCLQRKPKLLLLDEPSAGVAPNVAMEIYAWIKEKVIGTETAVLVVEQNLQFLPSFATRAVVMRNGYIHRDNLPLDHLADGELMFDVFHGDIALETVGEVKRLLNNNEYLLSEC